MKLLILDLDETLVWASKETERQDFDFCVGAYKVFKRPHLASFLKTIQAHYAIAVWSSASDEYVAQVVNQIFPKNYPLEFV